MIPDLQAIIAVPIETDFDDLSGDVKAIFDSLVVKYTDFPSLPYGGERLVLAHLLSPSDSPVEAINVLIQQYGLNWTLKRVQGWTDATVYLAEDISDFLPDEYDYDSNGDPIPGTERKPAASSWCIFGGAANWQ